MCREGLLVLNSRKLEETIVLDCVKLVDMTQDRHQRRNHVNKLWIKRVWRLRLKFVEG